MFLFLLCLLFLSFGSAEAATWTVTRTLDDGSTGTLSHAVTHAAAGDSIVFAGNVTTVDLTSTLYLKKALTISGPATIRQTGANERVLYVTADCTFNYLTITGGNFVPGTQEGNYWNGAGIYNYANLTMNNCTVTGNTVGGGVYNVKNLTMTGCTISNNTCAGSRHAGGINNEAKSSSAPVLTMYNCVVEGNSNPDTYGGGVFNGEKLFMYGCTVRSNSSRGSGGGIYLNLFSETTLAQGCVVTGNSPDQICGPGQYGSLSIDGSCTVGNTAGNKAVALSGFAQGSDPELRKTTGEPDVVAAEGALNDSGSGLFTSVKNTLHIDLGASGEVVAGLASMSATLYNAFTYENVQLADASGEGELVIEFTASWPERVRYYAAFAEYEGAAAGTLAVKGYVVAERGVQFETKPGQPLPDGVTAPDFYEEGEGLMTWRNVVTDNGPYDHNREDGVVTFRVCSIRAEAVQQQGGGGGGGCSVGVGSAWTAALLLFVPLVVNGCGKRRRRS